MEIELLGIMRENCSHYYNQDDKYLMAKGEIFLFS